MIEDRLLRRLALGALVVLTFWCLYAMALAIDLIAIEASTGQEIAGPRDYATLVLTPVALVVIVLLGRRFSRG